VKTLAAAGIGRFYTIHGVVRDKPPLRRAIDTYEVVDAAAFLLSDAGRGITGEVMMVDAGFHVLGM
jgi:enoyl-[acyl-carrier protein] reductase I